MNSDHQNPLMASQSLSTFRHDSVVVGKPPDAPGAGAGLLENRYEVAVRGGDKAMLGFVASFLRIAAQKVRTGIIHRDHLLLHASDDYREARDRNSGFDRRWQIHQSASISAGLEAIRHRPRLSAPIKCSEAAHPTARTTFTSAGSTTSVSLAVRVPKCAAASRWANIQRAPHRPRRSGPGARS